MAGAKNAVIRKVMGRLRKVLRAHIPDRYAFRLRAFPTWQDSIWDILVISDFFRGKGLVRRLAFLRQVEEEVLTPEEQFRFRVLPFTEREARERGL
jgi:predicted nucleotidyltransferase